MTDITLRHMTLEELLKDNRLHIPNYQRPYKWQRKHIRHLFYDVKEVIDSKKDIYQVGSLILHDKKQTLDIVDGQQRTISIALFLQALGKLNDYIGAQQLLNQKFDVVSCQHAKENFEEWKILIDLDDEKAQKVCDFLLKNCEIAVITMPHNRLSEAFQLFDSQNNRGKALEPHDLLKAYHLRNASEISEDLIENWEKIVTDEKVNLKDLFNQYLFRVRRWSIGETGLTKRRQGSYLRFTEDFIDDFKGVGLHHNEYPYLNLFRLLKAQNIDYPISLMMPIIDGEYFFSYINQSHKMIQNRETWFESLSLDSKMLKILYSTKQRYNRNRNLFDNLVLLFVDRFGQGALDKDIVETIFIWAYYPRIKARAIYDSTLANYAAGGIFQRRTVQKLFQLLHHASTPSDFLQKINRDQFEHFTLEKILEEEELNK